jgi:hypothetical protein
VAPAKTCEDVKKGEERETFQEKESINYLRYGGRAIFDCQSKQSQHFRAADGISSVQKIHTCVA